MNMMHRVVAVNIAKGPTIMLASGKLFDFLDPHGSDFGIEDIAHGLAHTCRYAGQCRAFYSVAEHSLLVADVAAECAYEALLHDAAEAFIGDITRPFKQLLPDYRQIESAVEDAIFERFNVDRRSMEIVKRADLRVLAAEQAQVMAPGCADWAIAAGIYPAPIEVRYYQPTIAKNAFLQRYYAYRSGR